MTKKVFKFSNFFENFCVFSSYLGQGGFIFHLEKLSILEFELSKIQVQIRGNQNDEFSWPKKINLIG